MTDEATKAFEKQRDAIAQMLYENFHADAGGYLPWDQIIAPTASGFVKVLGERWREMADLVVEMLIEAEEIGRGKAVQHLDSDDLIEKLEERRAKAMKEWIEGSTPTSTSSFPPVRARRGGITFAGGDTNA